MGSTASGRLDDSLHNLLDIGVLEGWKAGQIDDLLVIIEGGCHALANENKVGKGFDCRLV